MSVILLLIPGLFLIHACEQDLQPKVFEPGNISTSAVEYGSTFSSDGKEVYFARSEQNWGEGNMTSAIFYAVKEQDTWSKPQIMTFSGTYDDSDPHITRDGKSLYFISNRPEAGGESSADIWMVQKNTQGQWGAPLRLKEPINSAGVEYSPRTDNAGNLYFASTRSGGYGQGDLYVALHHEEGFAAPINLGSTLNSPTGEWNLEINGAGNVLIFEASGREENVSPYGDLYISFKEGSQWTLPQHMKELNTSGSDLCPFLSRDGKTLFYTSSDSLKGKSTHIYQIPFAPIRTKYMQLAKHPS